MHDNLSEYGYNFQSKVITALLSDKGFLQQVSDIIEPNYFESEANNWLVGKIITYYDKYRNAPTNEVFKSELLNIDDMVLKSTIVDSLKDTEKFKESSDLEYVKSTVLDFCKNQKMKAAIIESVDLLKGGKFDLIKKIIDNALKAGADKDIGHEYILDIISRYEEGARSCVSTGWFVIDDIMSGGLGNGELGVIVAPAGGGKSWGLVSVAANAVKKGCVYFTIH
jgi:hypothetical protein